jgi:hypothetical protein
MKRLVFTQVRPDYLWDSETGPDGADELFDDEAPSAFRVRWLVEADDWYKTPAAGWIPRLCLVH